MSTSDAVGNIETGSLNGLCLDYAVARALGFYPRDIVITTYGILFGRHKPEISIDGGPLISPSKNGNQAIQIIENNRISVNESGFGGTMWEATCVYAGKEFMAHGSTFIIAAMRCFVLSRMGDYVDIPRRLL